MTRLCLGALLVALAATAAAAQSADPLAPAALAALPRPERVRRLRQRTWDVVATHAAGTLTLDGRLDEADWARASPVTDLDQGQCNEGLPASERTDIRVLHDGRTLWIGFRAWDGEPAPRRHAAGGHLSTGGFYGGERESLTMNFNWKFMKGLGVVAGYTANWVDLPAAAFTTHVLSGRVQFSPRNDLAFLTLFRQYNHDTRQVSSNVRINWIPKPGTDVFLVYNETDLSGGRLSPVTRSLALKMNYLFQF